MKNPLKYISEYWKNLDKTLLLLCLLISAFSVFLLYTMNANDISGQVSLIEHAADELVRLMEEAGASFDTILNPVSKSNALAHAVAVRWSRIHPELTHTVVARKSTDPANTVRAGYRSVTTDADQTLSLTPEDAAYLSGKKILLMDDVFGGGGTTKALRELARKAGAEVSAHAVVAVEQGSAHPDGLFYLFELPVL